MSMTQVRAEQSATAARKVMAGSLLEMKRAKQPITALTATDYPTGRLVDEAGIDVILVGDSLAMTVLGHPDTLSITMEEMLHHTRAVRRGVRRALLVADMPYGSYHVSADEAVRNGVRFMKEAGAEAVKLEGGRQRTTLVEQLTTAEVPVVGHIGLTPQSLHRMGGYKVQGRSVPAIESLKADAAALEGAGAIALVVEGIPREVAAQITASLTIPVIGIGAGPECDGQILVFHDFCKWTFADGAKFVRRFADAESVLLEGLRQYREEVTARSFPNDAESYHLPAAVARELEAAELAGVDR